MKRFSKIMTTLVFVAVLLTGCVKYNANMAINSQGNVDVTFIVAFANSLLEEDNGVSVSGFSEEDKQKYEQKGFKVEDYKDANWTGNKISKSYNIEQVSSPNPVVVELDSYPEEETQFLFQSLGDKKYKGHFTIDPNNDDSIQASTEGMTPEQLESIYASMDYKYSVTLPSKPISHNADKVEGNTLTWNISFDKKTDIQYEFSLESDGSGNNSSLSNNISNTNENTSSNSSIISNSNDNTKKESDKKDLTMWIIIGVAGVAVLLIIIVVVVSMNKKKKNNAMNNGQAFVPPMAPGQQPYTGPSVQNQPYDSQQSNNNQQ